ncbi:MAG: small multi-drug export protein [Patescibacteria group bacterium]
MTELRASIPIAIEVYKLTVWKAWLISVIGNMLPSAIILYFIPSVHRLVISKRFLGSFFTNLLKRAEKKFSGSYAKYGIIGLAIFVGIPLPLTGAWTGALAAFVFNIPFKKAFWSILAGVCLAATAVTLITLFAGGTLRWLL